MSKKTVSKNLKSHFSSSESAELATDIPPSRDEIVAAARILKSAGSKKRERKAAAAVMSTTGGAKRGGENRAKNLTPEQRRDIARLGGLARQQKAREEDERLGFTKPRNKVLSKRELKMRKSTAEV